MYALKLQHSVKKKDIEGYNKAYKNEFMGINEKKNHSLGKFKKINENRELMMHTL